MRFTDAYLPRKNPTPWMSRVPSSDTSTRTTQHLQQCHASIRMRRRPAAVESEYQDLASRTLSYPTTRSRQVPTGNPALAQLELDLVQGRPRNHRGLP